MANPPATTNKFVLAMCALVVAVGAQSAMKDTSKFMSEVVIPHPASKAIIIFCMFFMTTRDWTIALMCCAGYMVVVAGMLDERHSYSVVRTERALP